MLENYYLYKKNMILLLTRTFAAFYNLLSK